MSDTPRVDKLVRAIGQWKVVYAGDARDLELEIIALQKQLAERDAALARCVEALKTADCPECHGVGFTIDEWTDTVAECCGRPTSSGDCCGYPVPTIELRQEQRQCQWCAYRDDALASIPASAQATAKVLAAARRLAGHIVRPSDFEALREAIREEKEGK